MKIYARNTIVKTILEEEADNFIHENHTNKSITKKLKTINLGLYHKTQLVGVAQFAPTRTSKMMKKYSLELLRLCFKKNTRVIGGASKLIKTFIKLYNPTDFFTYQDTSGENTNVYEKSGMILVKQDKTKKYLVAPGKTIKTGNRKEVLGMPYATRYGPDRILGTNIGEILTPEGKRKSNKKIFIEDLGWHIEETTGDKIWEWVNPNYTFYTYKITATDSEKYYYGVSHIKKPNATINDCLNDGYYGSGSTSSPNNKFINWFKKHKSKIRKEIINLHRFKAEAYEDEKNLVGNKWADDPSCLNSCAGGRDGGINHINIIRTKKLNCSIHGLSLHQGNSCLKCSSAKRYSIKECSIHGFTKFNGDTCNKCSLVDRNELNFCDKHGETIFIGSVCQKCKVQSNVSVSYCSVHGRGKFIGDKCYKCIDFGFSLKDCTIHGNTIFRGNSCVKCSVSKIDSVLECSVHGETVHRSGVCLKCRESSKISVMICSTHGKSKFQSGKCSKCVAASLYSVRECSVHGKSKFRKDSCIKCLNSKNYTMDECSVHGLVKHLKGKCCTCVAAKSKHTIWHVRKGVIVSDCEYCLI